MQEMDLGGSVTVAKSCPFIRQFCAFTFTFHLLKVTKIKLLGPSNELILQQLSCAGWMDDWCRAAP